MVEPVPVPQWHGHSDTSQYVDGWAQVIEPAGWSTAKADELRAIISSS